MKQILNSHDVSRWRERLRQTGLLPEAMVAEGNFFRIERDEILIRQGEVPLCLFCTLTGVTEVQSFLPNGRTLTVNTFRSPRPPRTSRAKNIVFMARSGFSV